MRDPERIGAPYRPGSSPATLDDLRWVFKKLLEIERRLAQVQAEQLRLNGHVTEDRKHLGAIVQNTNQLIKLILPTEVDIRELRKMYRGLLLPSRILRRSRRPRYTGKRGKPAPEATE
jgi:hypothetical protein